MNLYRIDTIKSKNFKTCSANGPGIRVIVWCQGCSIRCPGCHNSEIWSFDGGTEFREKDINYILEELENDIYSGITFLGGEPMADQNIEGFIDLAKEIKTKFGDTKTIWCYSGYTLEELQGKTKQKELLEVVDYLVDGPYIEKQRNIGLKFRGSKNQRIWEKINDNWELSKYN